VNGDLQEENRVMEDDLDQLRQHRTMLNDQLRAAGEEQQKLRTSYTRQIDNFRLQQLEGLEKGIEATRKTVDSREDDAGRDPPAARRLWLPDGSPTRRTLSTTGNVRGENASDDRAPQSKGMSDLRSEIRRRLRDEMGPDAYSMHEIDSSSRPSSVILRRAMACGGYRILNHDCQGTGHCVQIRLWADPYSRTLYYKICQSSEHD
jgi:hypothetical protein